MKTTLQILSLACVPMLPLAACDMKRDSTGTSTSTTSDGTTTTPAPRSTTTPPESNPSPTPAPDNTARNKSDAPGAPTVTKTPMDQSESAEHIKITADIRAAIIAMDGMSINAKNCKIITDSRGVVTLRGVVASQAEKDKIEAKARAFAGLTNVDNQLEITPG